MRRVTMIVFLLSASGCACVDDAINECFLSLTSDCWKPGGGVVPTNARVARVARVARDDDAPSALASTSSIAADGVAY